jgi:hypothetical protein
MYICDLYRQKLDSDLGDIVSILPLHKRRLMNKKKITSSGSRSMMVAVMVV